MKQTVLAHATDHSHKSAEESYNTILGYFYPEYITSLVLYIAGYALDSYFIAQLPVSASYTTVGVTNTLFHLITKVAEGFSVGMVVLCGYYNGAGNYKQAGKAVADSFWATCITGACVSSLLYVGVYVIYSFYGLSPEMVTLGVPFLRLRALGVFFNFVYLALIGFLRGIKNTRVPMIFSLTGALIFSFFDYSLIFGKYGFAPRGLQGSAVASVIQYCVMLLAALFYIVTNKRNRKYGIALLTGVSWVQVRNLLKLSWPVMLDKASLAASHVWLAKIMGMIAQSAPASSSAVSNAMVLGSFVAIKDIERFALLPAVALAHVVTFLVSNSYKSRQWQLIHTTIKRILILACGMVLVLLICFSFGSRAIISCIDKQGTFMPFACRALPIISSMVIFDVLQLILSAALRGAADVKTVMTIRLLVCLCYFMPVSYVLTKFFVGSMLTQFILAYGILYSGNAFMCLLYAYRFKTEQWKKHVLQEPEL